MLKLEVVIKGVGGLGIDACKVYVVEICKPTINMAIFRGFQVD